MACLNRWSRPGLDASILMSEVQVRVFGGQDVS